MNKNKGEIENMNLEQAIRHTKAKAEKLYEENCNSCAREHMQLAGWLEELAKYRDTGCTYKDVIDLQMQIKYHR